MAETKNKVVTGSKGQEKAPVEQATKSGFIDFDKAFGCDLVLPGSYRFITYTDKKNNRWIALRKIEDEKKLGKAIIKVRADWACTEIDQIIKAERPTTKQVVTI
jgi:hypothetical protein